MVGATTPTPCTSVGEDIFNPVYTCTLTRPGGYLAQAIWNTAGPSANTVPAGFVDYKDLLGNVTNTSAGTLITVGLKPKLLEMYNANQ
jgi:hypothetical protein